MKVCIDVKMRADYIYDLLLFHMYSKFSGFLINLIGLTVIMLSGLWLRWGKLTLTQTLAYMGVGVVVLIFTPLSLKIKAKKMMEDSKFQSVIQYGFDETGIEEQLSDHMIRYSWGQIEKAIATPKDIAFYLNGSQVLIMPKEQFKDNFMPVMQLIAQNLTRDKIYIR